MTMGTVSQTLNNLAGVLEVALARTEAEALRVLSAFLKPYASDTASAFFKRARLKGNFKSPQDGQRVADIEKILVAFQLLVDGVGTKASAKDFQALLDFLGTYRGMGLQELLEATKAALATPKEEPRKKQSALKTSIVSDYIRRLHSAFASDREFENVITELEANKAARTQEVVEIAGQITNESCTKLNRKGALLAIRDVRKASRSFDLKLRAMSGRSAA